MGCQASVSSSAKQKSLNQSPIKVAPVQEKKQNSALPLDVDEIVTVLNFWKAMSGSLTRTGILMFVK